MIKNKVSSSEILLYIISLIAIEQIELPNITDIVDKHWGNKDDLISALSEYNTYIQKLWEKAILQERASERESKLLSEIKELKKENKF